MSVLIPTPGELYTVRVYKNLDIAQGQVWANTYELRADATAAGVDVEQAVDQIVLFEKAIHQDTTEFDRAVISSWVPDGVPYDPESFISIPLTGSGTVASPAAAETLPLQVCLFVRRDVPSGRTGKLFYRGCLAEDDVRGRFGEIQLESPSTLQTRVDNALTASGMNDMFLGGTFPLKLVMVSGVGGAIVRSVRDLTVVSGRMVKFNNRYFDRA